eukprot:CAMPEP_0173065192 /NCGR_PEP_ID=MMETSP1102-20130122/5466_1 /TAXON_ID=49646 /ORGANISM="Geminigera sp., Strain Caron Lab Isolate" /LENGTH=273 /DNA_ID=CAMNT_0013932405 /DNA_START=297 /DNA_END=1120 /DNA_ORIENTATION=-
MTRLYFTGLTMDVPVATAPLDDVTNAVLEMTATDDAYVLLPEAFGAGVVVLVTFVVPAVLVPTIDNDDVLLLVEVLEGTGVDVAATPVVLDDGAAVVLVLVGINDANVLLLEVAGQGVKVLECTGVEVLAIPAVLDDASPVVLSPVGDISLHESGQFFPQVFSCVRALFLQKEPYDSPEPLFTLSKVADWTYSTLDLRSYADNDEGVREAVKEQSLSSQTASDSSHDASGKGGILRILDPHGIAAPLSDNGKKVLNVPIPVLDKIHCKSEQVL